MGKGAALLDKAVDGGCLYFVVAEGVDGAEGQVIGDEEQEVGANHLVGGNGGAGEGGGRFEEAASMHHDRSFFHGAARWAARIAKGPLASPLEPTQLAPALLFLI